MGTYVNQIPYVITLDGWFNRFGGYASESISSANDLADKLSDFTADAPDINFTPPDTIASNISTATVDEPTIPEYVPSGIQHPGAFAPQSVGTTLLTAPIFDIDNVSLNLPDLPSITSPLAPTKPDIDLTTEFPVSPDTILPDLPDLVSLELPTLDALNLPVFLANAPDSLNVTVPGTTFSFNEELYSDELLTKVKDELLVRLSGGTGLEPVVEAAIWNRGRDREHTAALQAERDVMTESGPSGFTRPSGASQSALDRVIFETQGKVIELSREIMVKQADLEQENIKHSIQQTIALEDILIREHSNVQNRALDVAKYTQNIALEIYKAAVSKYQMELELYKVESEVFQTLIEAEISKVTIFKAEIDAQLALGTINEQNVKVYTAQIDAIDSVVSMYKTEVEAVSTKLQGESIKIDAFKSEIDAYSSEIQANTEIYKGYSAQIEGEKTKSDIYESQVKGFATRVQSYATEQGALNDISSNEIALEELRLKSYLGNLEGYVKAIQSDQLNFQSQIDVYKGAASMYNAKTDYNTASANIALKDFELQLQQTQYSSSKALEAIKFNSQAVLSSNQNTIEGMKAAGNIQSQIASSSLNAISVSSSVSQSLSNSLSEGYSLSGSI